MTERLLREERGMALGLAIIVVLVANVARARSGRSRTLATGATRESRSSSSVQQLPQRHLHLRSLPAVAVKLSAGRVAFRRHMVRLQQPATQARWHLG